MGGTDYRNRKLTEKQQAVVDKIEKAKSKVAVANTSALTAASDSGSVFEEESAKQLLCFAVAVLLCCGCGCGCGCAVAVLCCAVLRCE